MILLWEARQRPDEVQMAHGRKKAGNPIIEYKFHAIMDGDYDPIRQISPTTASVHDSQVDLSEEGAVVYRDRGYQGAECKGYHATMKRGAGNLRLVSGINFVPKESPENYQKEKNHLLV